VNITGPLPSSASPKVDETGLGLRLNQRLAAEVLKVSADRVTLALEGVQVVAQLTSPEQAAVLSERQFATFVVRSLSGTVITLQLVQPGQSAAVEAAPSAENLIPNLIQQMGIPVSPETVNITRALLQQNLPVTAELVFELQKALGGIEGWGQPEAQVAAELKALGLPLSTGILALASQQMTALADLIEGLRSKLQQLLRSQPPSRLAGQIRQALALLDKQVVDCSAKPAELTENLRRSISCLSQSVERQLMLYGKQGLPQDGRSRQMILALAYLRRELAGNGESPLAKQIDRYLDGLRIMQLRNTEPVGLPAKGQWLRIDLPLDGFDCKTEAHSGQALQTAHLRIAYPPEGSRMEIDPAHTRLVLKIDLNPTDSLEIDLSLSDQRIGGRVTASNEDLRRSAENELPSLICGLEGLGYHLQPVKCEVAA
jgi:hypothetical protein